MSRQTLITAALHMAYPVGLRQHAYKLEKLLDTNSRGIIAALQPYVTIGCDMVELATEYTMVTPPDVEFKVFSPFGQWYGDMIKETSKLPTQEESLENLASQVFKAFTDHLSNDQDDTLKAKLLAFQQEYSDE